MRGIMRGMVVGIAAIGIVSVMASAATAQTPHRNRAYVQRSAAGTVIQPTRTIIHNADGSTTIITVPRRSYLDPGTEVPVGYPSHLDYAFPPGGDPGQPYWYFGPDTAGVGSSPLAQPFLLPGFTSYPSPY
jgi:hypothetical protein